MFLNICIGSTCFLLGFFLKSFSSTQKGKETDIIPFYKIIFIFFKTKLEKFKSLITLVESENKNKLKSFCISISIVLKSYLLLFIQYINKTVIHLENNKYLITYTIRGKIYKMIVHVPKGPSKIISILNEKQENITDIILPYIGPHINFHGCKYTPKCFNQKEILFYFKNEQEFKFHQNEIMNF